MTSSCRSARDSSSRDPKVVIVNLWADGDWVIAELWARGRCSTATEACKVALRVVLAVARGRDRLRGEGVGGGGLTWRRPASPRELVARAQALPAAAAGAPGGRSARYSQETHASSSSNCNVIPRMFGGLVGVETLREGVTDPESRAAAPPAWPRLASGHALQVGRPPSRPRRTSSGTTAIFRCAAAFAPRDAHRGTWAVEGTFPYASGAPFSPTCSRSPRCPTAWRFVASSTTGATRWAARLWLQQREPSGSPSTLRPGRRPAGHGPASRCRPAAAPATRCRPITGGSRGARPWSAGTWPARAVGSE